MNLDLLLMSLCYDSGMIIRVTGGLQGRYDPLSLINLSNISRMICILTIYAMLLCFFPTAY